MIVDELKPYFIRWLSLRDRGVITESEAASGVLVECIFTMLDHPNAWQGVVEALEIIPVALLSTIALNLAAKRLPDGGWEWPIIGAIASNGGRTQFRRADSIEAAVSEKLCHWLTKRVDALRLSVDN